MAKPLQVTSKRNAGAKPQVKQVVQEKWKLWMWIAFAVFVAFGVLLLLRSSPELRKMLVRHTNQLLLALQSKCLFCYMAPLFGVGAVGCCVNKLWRGAPKAKQENTRADQEDPYETCLECPEAGEESTIDTDGSDVDEEGFTTEIELPTGEKKEEKLRNSEKN